MKTIINILIAISFLFAACSHVSTVEDENIVKPILLEKPKLIYPISAQENNHSGSSKIFFTISEEGNVTKTIVRESSGYEDLDKAAENYCKRLKFQPAKFGEKPIEFGMRLEIKFYLENLDKDISRKIAVINKLYKRIALSYGDNKLSYQKKILDQHFTVIDEIRDCQKFNEYVYGVVQSKLKLDWQVIGKNCPISFLLYHDFLERFPDYYKSDTVLSMLEHSLKQDLDYIDITNSQGIKNNRIQLIKKIRQFVESNYPNVKLIYPSTEIKLEENNIS